MTYAKKLALAVDQLVNAAFGGYPDESLSARSYRWNRDGVRSWPYKVINSIFFWQKDHCKSAFSNEKKLKQFPPEYRGNI